MMPVNVPGLRVVLAGQVYVVPPLTLGDLEQLQERIVAVKGEPDGQTVGTVLDVATCALKRNYPEITRAEVARMVDVGNMMEVFEAVMDMSGLKRKAQEAAGLGGAPASADSTGGSSTPT